MNNTVYDIDFTRALPEPLKNDNTMLALGRAIAGEIQENIRLSRLAIIYARLDELDESILDILARDLHVDWYEDTYPVETKRQVIKYSVKVHKRLGTKYAVESVVRTYFVSGQICEWFEYGGNPFHFSIALDFDETLLIDTYNKLKAAIDTCKRASAHMEALVFRSVLIENVMAFSAGNTQRLFLKPSVKSLTREINRISVSLVKPIYHITYDSKYRYDGEITWKGYTGPYFFPTRSFDRILLRSENELTTGFKVSSKNYTVNRQDGKNVAITTLRNQNKYKTRLSVRGSVLYDGQYCYDGTAFYDGITTQYLL